MMKEIATTITEQTGNVVKLGNVYGDYSGMNYAGNVWDVNYFCPTIRTCKGGGNPQKNTERERNDNINRRSQEEASTHTTWETHTA